MFPGIKILLTNASGMNASKKDFRLYQREQNKKKLRHLR